MVAVITYPKILTKALNYHEQKVKTGKATCIHAENFLLDHDKLRFSDKFNRLNDQMALNPTVQTKLLHVSLNFEPTEKIDKDELKIIADTYMSKIGFADQPFLVYQHNDAGHPHIHILTTTIKDDGAPIYLHNIGRNQSETARTEIENEHGLIRAEGRGDQQTSEIPFIDLEGITYGKRDTKRSISNVLDAVLKRYQYTSLHELNAILKLRNVVADRGQEGGRIHRTGGLIYRVLDNEGKYIGKPIKASSIYSKPTLAYLHGRFEENKVKRIANRSNVKKIVSDVLAGATHMQNFIQALKHHKIDTILRQNDIGYLYGITFVDHTTRCVFNGSDLGQLSAADIQKKFNSVQAPSISLPQPAEQQLSLTKADSRSPQPTPPTPIRFERVPSKQKEPNEMIRQYDLLKQLMRIEKGFTPVHYALSGKKKKKKRKRKLGT